MMKIPAPPPEHALSPDEQASQERRRFVKELTEDRRRERLYLGAIILLEMLSIVGLIYGYVASGAFCAWLAVVTAALRLVNQPRQTTW